MPFAATWKVPWIAYQKKEELSKPFSEYKTLNVLSFRPYTIVGESKIQKESRYNMESSTKKKLVHVLPHRKQAPRKRTSSLSYEERQSTPSKETNCSLFTFPVQPQNPNRPLSETKSYITESDSDSYSDTNTSQYHDLSSLHTCVHPRLRCQGYQSEGSPVPLHAVPRLLPPIGVFWDIENCQVPKGRSAVAVAQVIRKRFFTGFREAEFLVVCDVKKESNQILQELNDAQVNLIHVASMCKNAADEKLRQSMRRFADIHGSPASIILISGDINFAADITDLRHRKKINVILLHMENASENLILCASEHYSFSELVEALPPRGAIKQSNQPVEVIVYNLPAEKDSNSVKSRLRQLSDNCGGRVTALKQTCATIRFTSFDVANRAQKRMDGEDVFGHKIQVSVPVRVIEKEGSPQKFNGNSAGKKFQMNGAREISGVRSDNGVSTSSGLYRCIPAAFNFLNQHPCVENWSVYGSTSTSVNVAQEYYTGLCSGFHVPVDAAPHAQTFSAYGTQNPPCFLSRNSPAEMINVPCGFVDKAPRVLRKIRGTHKGVLLEQEPTEMEENQPAFNSGVSRLQTARPLVKTGPSDASSQKNTPNSRDPSPLMPLGTSNIINPSSGKGWGAVSSRTPTPALQQYDGDLDEPEHFFHPINSSDLSNINGSNSNESVELHVSNLDQKFGAREMKKILLNAFREHVMVLSLLVLVQQDGSLNARVRLASQQDAQYAIYKLQRHKIGHKRIRISHGSITRPSPQLIRSQVISLLQEVPNHRLPLFKFCELYESRFLCSISISDIYKVKECEVLDGPRGRIVSLLVETRNSPSPQLQVFQEMEELEPPFCPFHGQEIQPNKGWAEQEVSTLPSVNISLKLLSVRIHALLQTHNGNIHLNSLPQCYEAQFEPFEEDREGVALEHLVSCLPGIQIFKSPASIKYIRWSKTASVCSSNSKTDEETGTSNTSLAGKLSVFSREIVELLKTSPRCQILFDKFIPAYHHHFGRQCRVADYGFTKLIELLESLPQTIQVLGEGNKRTVTLSHRLQLRRFMGDLVKVLRNQVNKQILLSELPAAFECVFNKPLIVNNYGVCDVMDLLSNFPDASIVVSPVNEPQDDMLIAIPKREQTPEEIEKTKQFAAEVITLLRHVPNCTMRFNKFIPAHHIHFGWQCRVADYGFSKLIELFEAVPDIVQIINIDGERWVKLTKEEHLKVLSDQIASLLQGAPQCTLSIAALKNSFRDQFGYSLHPQSFNCETIEELLSLLPQTLKVAEIDGKQNVTLITTDLQQFIKDIQQLVVESGGNLPLASVESKYLKKYGRPCHPSQFGYPSLGALLQNLHDAVRLRGRGTRRSVVLVETTQFAAAAAATTALAPAASTAVSEASFGACSARPSVTSNAPNYSSINTTVTFPDLQADSSSTIEGSKALSSEKSSASEALSDLGTMNEFDPVGHPKQSTPGKGPWSQRIFPQLKETDSPAAMLSPSSNLLPAFSSQRNSSKLVMSPLPPLYSYPPFLPGHVASPEPSTLPLPQLSLAAPLLVPQEAQQTSSLNESSSSSTPNRTKVKRRLAAQFQTPLDLP
ncbi:Limkain-b1 [Gryllus bimaculatus]|nr:Limkain-b1 [Gryllus bimaculatus]